MECYAKTMTYHWWYSLTDDQCDQSDISGFVQKHIWTSEIKWTEVDSILNKIEIHLHTFVTS